MYNVLYAQRTPSDSNSSIDLYNDTAREYNKITLSESVSPNCVDVGRDCHKNTSS